MFTEKQPEERPARVIHAAHQPYNIAEQPTLPMKINRRSRWLLFGLCLLLALVILAALLGPSAFFQWFSPQMGNPALGPLLHPKTSVVRSTAITNTVNLFMQTMLQKNWSAMWPMLAPDAQHLWQNEQDFTHFEQAKFGALTLNSYTVVGQAVLSHPWLDPDTTKVYNSAATVEVSLQATAPPGLLTAPSDQALNHGLFQHTLCALIQDHKQTWKVLVAGPADLDAPMLVPASPPV